VTKAQAQAFGALGFKTVAEFDQAANEFRLYFRANALTIAERMLFESGRVLNDADARYQIRGNKVTRDCQELYDELYSYGGPSADQLKDAHPILRNPAALRAVSPAKNVWEFSWRLTLFAKERLRDLGFVQNNLRREPDVVFRWEPVVRATFDELGLEEDSIYGWVIREQRGKPGSRLGEKLIHYGVELLLFAISVVSLPVGLTIGITRAIGKTAAAGSEYAAGTREFEAGLRESAPNIAPVILAPVEELGPYALHGVFSWLKGLRGAAQVEKLAAAGAGTERKLEQSLVPPHDAPNPPPALHVETTPPVTTEPSVARPAVDVEPPVAPKPELAPVATEPRSIQIRAAEVPAPATAAELTALRNTETSVLGRRGDLARGVDRLKVERGGLDGEGGLRGQIAKRDKLLEAGTLSQTGKDNVGREIKELEKQLDAKDAQVTKLEAELSSADEELAYVRDRLRSEGGAPAGQPPHLPAGRLRETEVGEAFNLGPKNNQLVPNPGGADFIPDFVDGNPTSLVWGRPYHFREVKDWADMSDTGNLSAMLDYVSNSPGSRLTIYYRSNTYMSGPITTKIEALRRSGKVDLVPFLGE